MREPAGGVPVEALRAWIGGRGGDDAGAFASGYQGHVHLFEHDGRRLVVKSASGRGLARRLRLRMLRNEHEAYTRLSGLPGVPACHGLLDGRHLLLEYVEGTPFRNATLADRELFFARLLGLIRAIHGRGVAHGDLKKKDNLLVVGGTRPCIVDFGVAVVRRRRWAPINAYAWRLARRFDYNAWVKLKHGSDLSGAPEEDLRLARRTVVERVSRRIKSAWLRLRGGAGA